MPAGVVPQQAHCLAGSEANASERSVASPFSLLVNAHIHPHGFRWGELART